MYFGKGQNPGVNAGVFGLDYFLKASFTQVVHFLPGWAAWIFLAMAILALNLAFAAADPPLRFVAFFAGMMLWFLVVIIPYLKAGVCWRL